MKASLASKFSIRRSDLLYGKTHQACDFAIGELIDNDLHQSNFGGSEIFNDSGLRCIAGQQAAIVWPKRAEQTSRGEAKPSTVDRK
jgi:hypothetical protein